MTTRKNISLSNKTVIEVFEAKVKQNKASAFVEECILFYLQYKPLINEVTDTSTILALIKGGGVQANTQQHTSEKKKNRIGGLLK